MAPPRRGQRRDAFDLLREQRAREDQEAADMLMGVTRPAGPAMAAGYAADPLDDLEERILAAELLQRAQDARLGGPSASEPIADAGAAGRDPSVVAQQNPYDPMFDPSRRPRRVVLDAPVRVTGRQELPPGGAPDAGYESPPLPEAPIPPSGPVSAASGMTPAQEEAFLREEAAGQDWANQTFGAPTQAPGTGGVEAGAGAPPGAPTAPTQDRTIAIPGYPQFTVPPGQEATATARIPAGGRGGVAFPSPQAAQAAFLGGRLEEAPRIPPAALGAPGEADTGSLEEFDANRPRALQDPLEAAQVDADIEARMLDTSRQLDAEDAAEMQSAQAKEVRQRQEEELYQRTQAEVEARRAMNEHQALVTSVRSMRADPNRFFSTRTAPGMFGAAMALALADVTPGRGAALIESLIQQDLQAQEIDLQHARAGVDASANLLGHMRAVHRDEETARMAARDAMLERFRLEAEQLALRQSATTIGQQAQVAAAQIREQQEALRATIAQRNFAAYLEQARRAAAGGRRPLNLQVRVENPTQGQNRVPGSIQERIAAGEASAAGLRRLAARIRAGGGGLFEGSRLTQAGRSIQEAYATEHLNVSNAMAGLQMTEHEMEAVNATMADPTSFTQRLFRSNDEMARSLEAAASRLTAKARNLARMNSVPSPEMDTAAVEPELGAMDAEEAAEAAGER